jgi:hypothetical protein
VGHSKEQRRLIHIGNIAEMLIITLLNCPVFTVLPGINECLKYGGFRRASRVSTLEGKVNRQSLL